MKSLVRCLLWRLGRVAVAPWADAGETACLVEYARNKRRLAEIGVWEGGTTKMLRQVMASDGVLFAIDPFPGGRLGLSYQRPIAHGEVRRIPNGTVRARAHFHRSPLRCSENSGMSGGVEAPVRTSR
jgi:hypothetical protein